jgi:hypothetical protein
VRLIRGTALFIGALVVSVSGIAAPFVGMRLSYRYKGQKLGGVLEGDWFFWFGVFYLAFGVCAAIRLFRLADRIWRAADVAEGEARSNANEVLH